MDGAVPLARGRAPRAPGAPGPPRGRGDGRCAAGCGGAVRESPLPASRSLAAPARLGHPAPCRRDLLRGAVLPSGSPRSHSIAGLNEPRPAASSPRTRVSLSSLGGLSPSSPQTPFSYQGHKNSTGVLGTIAQCRLTGNSRSPRAKQKAKTILIKLSGPVSRRNTIKSLNGNVTVSSSPSQKMLLKLRSAVPLFHPLLTVFLPAAECNRGCGFAAKKKCDLESAARRCEWQK